MSETDFTKEEFETVRRFLFNEFLPMMQDAHDKEFTGASFIVLGLMEDEEHVMCSQMVVHSDAAEEALQIARDAEDDDLRAAVLDIPLAPSAAQAAAGHTRKALEDGIGKALVMREVASLTLRKAS